MSKWQTIPRTNKTADDLGQYIGCLGRLSRPKGGQITGRISQITPVYAQLGDFVVSFKTGDLLEWDTNGPQPKERYSDEIKALGRQLYATNVSAKHGSDMWDDLFDTTREAWYKTAQEAHRLVTAQASCCGRHDSKHDRGSRYPGKGVDC